MLGKYTEIVSQNRMKWIRKQGEAGVFFRKIYAAMLIERSCEVICCATSVGEKQFPEHFRAQN